MNTTSTGQTPEQVGHINAETAIDQRNEPMYEGNLHRVLSAYATNVRDTLRDEGINDPMDVAVAMRAYWERVVELLRK